MRKHQQLESVHFKYSNEYHGDYQGQYGKRGTRWLGKINKAKELFYNKCHLGKTDRENLKILNLIQLGG